MIVFLILFSCCWFQSFLSFKLKNFNSPDSSRTLLQAHVIYRHGNRTPVKTFPTDINQNWDEGWGQLTKAGKNLEYQLGKKLNSRYVNSTKLVSNKHIHSQVYIRSSPSERCLMSAELQVAGMFPPKEDQIWNEDLLWQPIPIYTTTDKNDYLLRAFDVDCPRKNEIDENLYKSNLIKTLNEQEKKFLDYISEQSGSKVSIGNIWTVYFPLMIEIQNNKSVNPFASPDVISHLKMLTLLEERIFFGDLNNSTDLKIIFSGKLIDKILNNFQVAVNLTNITINEKNTKSIRFSKKVDVNPTASLYLYSAHDITIFTLFATLGIPVDHLIDFGAAFSIELWLEKNQTFTVEFQYLNSTDFHQVYSSNCTSPCKLDDFIKNFKKFAIPDVDFFCNKSMNKFVMSETTERIVIWSILISYSIIMTATVIIQLITSRKNKGFTLINNDQID